MKVLTKNHPLSIKFDKLNEYLDNNDIEIEIELGRVLLIDTITGVSVCIKDLDDGTDVYGIPPFMDYKLVLEPE